MVSKLRIALSFVATAVALVVLFVVAVNAGSLHVTPQQLFNGLFVAYDDSVSTIFDLRFPRIFIAIFGGAALAVAGVILQAVIRNPLADPGIIGVTSGASFAAVLVTAFLPQLYYFTPLIACCGGFVAFVVVYALSWRGGLSPLRVILVGVAVSTMFSGLLTAFNSGTGSSMSSVSNLVNSTITMKTWSDFQVIVCYTIPVLVVSAFCAKRCNILALEDKTARSLGINVDASRFALSCVAVLLASSATAIVGSISFLGLIVPHIARILVGTEHKALIPYSMLLGAFVLLLADTIGRTIVAPFEISAAVIMSVVGGPAFILLLLKAGRNYGE